MSDSVPGNTSIVGAICAVVLAIVGFFRDWRKYRADGKAELKQRIDEVQSALNIALEQGMITDAHRLQKELRELWERYRRSSDRRLVAALVASSAITTGCFSARPHGEYIVIGERINIVEPGQEIVVPPLVSPAKKWYLVDNVGLAGWLGIEVREER